jgi:hypothetical protein
MTIEELLAAAEEGRPLNPSEKALVEVAYKAGRSEGYNAGFVAGVTEARQPWGAAMQAAHDRGYEAGVKRADGYNAGFIAGVVEAQARIAEGVESAREADLDDGYDWRANQ